MKNKKPIVDQPSPAEGALQNELDRLKAELASTKDELSSAKAELVNLQSTASTNSNINSSTANSNRQNSRKRQSPATSTEQPSNQRQKSTVQQRYILNGESGEIELSTDQSISFSDLSSNIQHSHLTEEQWNEDNESKRLSWGYTAVRINGVDLWLPKGVVVLMSNNFSMLKGSEARINRLKHIFSKEKCVLSRQSMRILNGFALHNSGGSDTGTQMVMAGAFKIIFVELGLLITNEQLAKGTPCQTSLANAEFRGAAEVRLLISAEMRLVQYYSFAQDGGHRGNLEHLARK